MTRSNRRRHQNQRIAKNKKRRHRIRCAIYKEAQILKYNNILFETFEGQVKLNLDFNLIQSNHRILKNKLMLELKEKIKLIDIASKSYTAPPSSDFICIDLENSIKPDLIEKQTSWFSYFGL
tara:strand:+ start:15076 stop:15441 length:366 start_codon:yes stop_codon:yes gene_type:complete